VNHYILAIDQGTTSTRAMIFDHDLNVVAVSQREFPSFYPHSGWVEQNADEIWGSVVAVIGESLAKARLEAKDINALAITNQRETTVVWDKSTGLPVYFALVWQSRQSAELCDEMKQRGVEELIRAKTGLVIDSYFSASKIRWILDHIDKGQERADNNELAFGTIDTWLTYKLTKGKIHVTDVSNASRTLLMDLDSCCWDKQLCDLWNIPMDMLPKIVSTSEVVGVTEPQLFGAPIPIAALVGDQQSALFGQLCLTPGEVKNTYGTGCFLLMNTGNQRIASHNGLLTTVGWRINNQTVYALEGSVFVAGAAVQWLRDGMKLVRTSAESESLAKSVSDNGGVIVVPAFVGMGAPYWNQQVRGAIFGLTRAASDAHIVRATLESIAYQTADVVKAMEDDAGLTLAGLQVDGGASRNDFLMQFQADILNVSVHRPAISETTALGAAMLAGLAVGVWKSVDELKEKWQVDQIFESKMSEQDRLNAMEKWHRAIHACMEF